jgi:hypothetical protein
MLNYLEETRVTEQDPDVATRRGAAPRRELEEGPTLQLLPETLTSTLSLFSNYNSGIVSLLQSSSLVCSEVRRGFSIYRGGDLEKWRTSPSFQGPTRPPQGRFTREQCGARLPKSVEQRTGREPDSRWVN